MAYVHELSGSKLRSQLGAALNEAAVADPLANNNGSFAAKQLEKMGWKAGRGLGKNLQGMATHIKVKKREDDVGLGHVKPELEQQSQWWTESMGNVFAKLNGGKKNPAIATAVGAAVAVKTAEGVVLWATQPWGRIRWPSQQPSFMNRNPNFAKSRGDA